MRHLSSNQIVMHTFVVPASIIIHFVFKQIFYDTPKVNYFAEYWDLLSKWWDQWNVPVSFKFSVFAHYFKVTYADKQMGASTVELVLVKMHLCINIWKVLGTNGLHNLLSWCNGGDLTSRVYNTAPAAGDRPLEIMLALAASSEALGYCSPVSLWWGNSGTNAITVKSTLQRIEKAKKS